MSDTDKRMGEVKGIETYLGGILKDVDPSLTALPKNKDDEEDDSSLTGEDRYRLSFTETLREAVYEFGGPRGVAREYKKTHDEAPAGSATRARIITHLVQGIQDHGEDMDLADDESMDAVEGELRLIHMEEMLEKLPDVLRAQVAGYLK